jgi:GntR family transcriptional repressor for pyruvate dehydrogenase complex
MRKRSSLLVNRVAQDLRKQAFAATPGAYLGSEAALVQKFGVSRPTFRQAAKVLQQEQLIVIKPGIGGGYFVRQPDSAAVAHMTGVYLQSRNITVTHLIETFKELYIIVAGAAAARGGDEAVLEPLLEFMRRERETLSNQIDWNTYVCSQTVFVDILADLSRNPLMKLFFEIARETLTNYLIDDIVPLKPAKIAQARAIRMRLTEAIYEGDPEIAQVLARRYMLKAEHWASCQ